MLLLEAEVEQFRRFREPRRWAFHPGLNLIVGPNESGKSTLQTAIESALTVPPSGTALVKSFEPHGGGKPRVRLVFEHGGERFTLEKRFRNNDTRLRVRGQELEGDAAEARLREALGVGTTRRRDTREHLGIWPLLWARQGDSVTAPTDPDALTTGGRSRLSDRLRAAAGDLAEGVGLNAAGASEGIGGGVLEQARQRYLRYYTAGGAESTRAESPFKVRERLDEALAGLAALRQRAAESADWTRRHRGVEAQLEQVEQELTERQEELNEARKALADARRRAAEAERLETAAALVQGRARQAVEAVQRREALRERVARARADLERVDVAALRGAAQAAARAAHHAREAEGQARGRRQAARASERARQAAADRARRLQDAEPAHERVLATLKQAQTAEAEAERLQVVVDAERVDGRALERLQHLQRGLEQARQRLAAATPRLRVRAERALQAGGVEVRPGSEAEVPLTQVDGRGLLLHDGDGPVAEVFLAGEQADLSTLHDAVESALTAWRGEVERLGLAVGVQADEDAVLVAARERADARARADGDLRAATERLKLLAPDGVNALRRLSQQQADELQQLQRPDGEASDPADAPDLDAVEAVFEAAVSATAARQAEAHAAEADASRAESETRRLDAESQTAARALEQDLSEAGEDAALQTALLTLRAEAEAAGRALDAFRAAEAPEGRDPDAVQSRLLRLETAADQARAEAQRLREERSELRGKLQNTAALGLADRIDAAEAEAERLEAELALVERDAGAAELLFKTLSRHRGQAEAATLEPLQEALRPLLRRVLPDAEAAFEVDDKAGLAFGRLERTDVADGRAVEDGFDLLSGGTREQVGVAVRLAMAQVLAHDEPLTVMLDDAFVNTDDARHQRVIEMIHDVAPPLQVLLFTCHERRARDLGVPEDRILRLS